MDCLFPCFNKPFRILPGRIFFYNYHLSTQKLARLQIALNQVQSQGTVLPQYIKSLNHGATFHKNLNAGQTGAPPPAPSTKKTDKSESHTVDVSEVVVSQRLKQGLIRFKFTVKNIREDGKPVSGYVFLLLKYKDAVQKQWITLPPVSLVSGAPYPITSGHYFKISNYKTVTFKLKQGFNLSRYNQANVVVYDKSQHIIFNRLFSIVIKAPGQRASS